MEEYTMLGSARVPSLAVGVVYGSMATLFKTGFSVIETLVKLEEAYAPENPEDLFSPQNQALIESIEGHVKQFNDSLRLVYNNPSSAVKNICTGIENAVIEKWNNFVTKLDQDDNFGAGQVLGETLTNTALAYQGITSTAKLAAKEAPLILNSFKNAARSSLTEFAEMELVGAKQVLSKLRWFNGTKKIMSVCLSTALAVRV